MRQALRTWVTKLRRSSALPIAEPPPVGGHTGATTDPTTRPSAPNLVRQPRQIVIARIDRNVRFEQEEIHAIESRAVNFSGGGQAQHGIQADGRLRIRAFAHQAGPHGVVDAGEVVVRTRHIHDAPY